MSVRAVIRQRILADYGTGRLPELRDDDGLLEAGVVDSVKLFRLVEFLEAEFGFRLSGSDLTLSNLNSIDGMAALVERKRGAQPPRSIT